MPRKKATEEINGIDAETVATQTEAAEKPKRTTRKAAPKKAEAENEVETVEKPKRPVRRVNKNKKPLEQLSADIDKKEAENVAKPDAQLEANAEIEKSETVPQAESADTEEAEIGRAHV